MRRRSGRAVAESGGLAGADSSAVSCACTPRRSTSLATRRCRRSSLVRSNSATRAHSASSCAPSTATCVELLLLLSASVAGNTRSSLAASIPRSPASLIVNVRRPFFIARKIVVRLRPESLAASPRLSCAIWCVPRCRATARTSAQPAARQGECRNPVARNQHSSTPRQQKTPLARQHAGGREERPSDSQPHPACRA
jgi:hypothetical protein